MSQELDKQNQLLKEGNELLSQRRGINSESKSELQDIANVLQDQLKFLKFQSNERREIQSLSRSINKIASENYSIVEKELGTQNLIKKIEKDKGTLNKKINQLSSIKVKLIKDAKDLTEDEKKLYNEITQSLQLQTQESKKLLAQIENIKRESELISQSFGVKTLGAISDITKSIPGLSRFSKPFQEAEEIARKQVIQNQKIKTIQDINLKTGKGLTKEKIKELGLEEKLLDKNGDILKGSSAIAKLKKSGDLNILEGLQRKNPMSPMLAGIKSIGPALTKALGPLVLLKELVNAFLQSDKIVGDMAKGLNMSYGEALDMKQELTSAANASGDLFVTSKGMAESLTAINQTLGTNVMLNKEDLVTFTKLREVAGLTNKELMGIQSLSLATGKSLEKNTGEFLAQAKITSTKQGVILNEKELMKEVSELSAATTLSLGKNPKALADAVATAKSLGFEMRALESVASSLLDFESSIENELQAELLLGKNINLEKARQAALNNDIATMTKEIAQQVGNAEEFGRLNVIQQDAIAKSVGLSREELAKSLFVQEQIGNATGDEAKKRQRILNQRIQDTSLEQVQRELEEGSIENLENQASMQDKFNASVEKLKEIFTTVAEALMPIFDILSDVFKIVGPIVNILVRQLMPTLKLVGGIVMALVEAIQFITTFGKSNFSGTVKMFKGFGDSLGETVQGKIIKGESNDLVGDLNSPSKGKTQISTKEGGLFELSPNDDIIAAPGASQALVNATQSQPTIVNNNVNNKATEETNSLLKQILTKQGTVTLDTAEVGTAISMNTYEIQ